MQWSSLTARMRRATVCAVLFAVLSCGVPAVASAVDYVALGDSYSSGTGTRTYFDSGCERSVSAYPYLIKGSLGSSFGFQACGLLLIIISTSFFYIIIFGSLAFGQTFGDGSYEVVNDNGDRLGCIVISGDGEVNLIWITIGINDTKG